ncbi:hypothetical protein [Flavobacterium capsici]|uniref:Uncharacterized protein n=1 Tax=Flavobacterium capsici TaxID=3075618 RepID=A0AA96F002_9FLAO|nr:MULTISPECIES: hypothetical protein [unclassified Flavobacterium]WNM19947.1 hypothetical protein RN608_04515 [Flavobacterium sp. PMR2A8]WNM21336.1 hypothetical protein RN605_11685 [Flavobacterium sp. PMTSA4]
MSDELIPLEPLNGVTYTSEAIDEIIEKSNPRNNVPNQDIDFGKVATDVASAWTAKPEITLLWSLPAELTDLAARYNTELAARLRLGGSRPQITDALRQLDDTIDQHISYVKGYITDKYTKEIAPSYFPSFGIVHKKDKYVMPADQNTRLASLNLLLEGLHDNDFNDNRYGRDFWQPIYEQYGLLLGQATATDGDVSAKVSSKNELKKSITKIFRALINVIKGNYPDTYKAELRTWGFQKEKY